MKRVLVLISVTFLVSGCTKTITVTNEEFQKFTPFEATLVSLKEMPCSEDSVPSAMTLRDYKVILQKADGSKIIIQRVSAILGNNTNWPGTIPIPLIEPTIKTGAVYKFPADLYKIHPEVPGEATSASEGN